MDARFLGVSGQWSVVSGQWSVASPRTLSAVAYFNPVARERCYLLMVRIVGATLVGALVGSRWLNAPCCLGTHKGQPYYRFGAAT